MDEEKFNRIKDAIDQHHKWPSVYMFKFIVPSSGEAIAKVQALFSTHTAEIRMTESSNGNYVSITANEVMTSADSVMDCYRKAAKIEGLIAL